MLIEATELLYKDLGPADLAKCYLICPMTTHKTGLQIEKPSNNVSMNAFLRSAIELATGRDYSVQSGPVAAAARGKRPHGAVAYTWKGFRRAMQQLGLGKGLSDLDLRAICDWQGDSGERYFEVTEDVRGRLIRKLHDIPVAPLNDLVLCYAGAAPENLAYGSTDCNSADALREWAVAKIKSAIPSYDRGDGSSVHGMLVRIRQMLHPFRALPKPTPGTFTGRPWGIAPSSIAPPAASPLPQPKQEVMQLGMELVSVLSLPQTLPKSILVPAVAAASALAVALAGASSDTALSALRSIIRSAAAPLQLQSDGNALEIMARGALLAAQLHEREYWPPLFLDTTLAMSMSRPSTTEYDAALKMLRVMQGLALLDASTQRSPAMTTTFIISACPPLVPGAQDGAPLATSPCAGSPTACSTAAGSRAPVPAPVPGVRPSHEGDLFPPTSSTESDSRAANSAAGSSSLGSEAALPSPAVAALSVAPLSSPFHAEASDPRLSGPAMECGIPPESPASLEAPPTRAAGAPLTLAPSMASGPSPPSPAPSSAPSVVVADASSPGTRARSPAAASPPPVALLPRTQSAASPQFVVFQRGRHADVSRLTLALASVEAITLSNGTLRLPASQATFKSIAYWQSLGSFAQWDKKKRHWTIAKAKAQLVLQLLESARQAVNPLAASTSALSAAALAALLPSPAAPAAVSAAAAAAAAASLTGVTSVGSVRPFNAIPPVRVSRPPAVAPGQRLQSTVPEIELVSVWEKYAFWHGTCEYGEGCEPGMLEWPPLRLGANRKDMVWVHSPRLSKVKQVCEFIDGLLMPPVGILLPRERPTHLQMEQAHRFCLNLSSVEKLSTFSQIYDKIRSGDTSDLESIMSSTQHEMGLQVHMPAPSRAVATAEDEVPVRRPLAGSKRGRVGVA